MTSDIQVTFPGGLRVDAQVGGATIHTDQPVLAGGDASAPAPFDLFLASLATCAGIYALGYCRARGLSTEGLALLQRVDYDEATKLPSNVRLELTLPKGFPKHHEPAILRAMGSCKVKKTLAAAPTFDVVLASDAMREERVEDRHV
jgi:putative redox protein